MNEKALTPADLHQCQAEKPNGEGPFTLGGGHKMIRCQSRPSVVITEKNPGPDGMIGSMSLCFDCFKVFLRQDGTPEVTVKKLPE